MRCVGVDFSPGAAVARLVLMDMFFHPGL